MKKLSFGPKNGGRSKFSDQFLDFSTFSELTTPKTFGAKRCALKFPPGVRNIKTHVFRTPKKDIRKNSVPRPESSYRGNQSPTGSVSPNGREKAPKAL